MIDTSKLRRLMALAIESLDSVDRNGTRSLDKALVDLRALGLEALDTYARFKFEEVLRGKG